MRTLIVGSVLAAALFLAGFSLAGERLHGEAHRPPRCRPGGAGAQGPPRRRGLHRRRSRPHAHVAADVRAADREGSRCARAPRPAARRRAGRDPALRAVRLGRARQGHRHREGARRAARAAAPTSTSHTAKNAAGEIRGQVAGPHGVMPAPTEDVDVRDDDERRLRPTRSVALLFPVVGVVVVAVPLPEAGLVVVGELDPAQPLRGLPEVATRDEEAHRPAVVGRRALAVRLVDDERVLVLDRRERDVGGEALLRVGDDELRAKASARRASRARSSGRP